ncbi:Cytochrome C' [Marinospirillum celere]|uniref:Cytochrome C n=1 Tax=Marinospirillum celere TaxID=1122252 RepID=A0A1I1ER56_9GAMM|nr:cytochrome c [Marinospirillum celere]SFB89477.1 Cytochrome C' [Marinospirillum celere]
MQNKKWLPLGAALILTLGLSLPMHAGSLSEDVDLRIETFDEIDRLFKALRFKVVNMRSEDHKGAMEYSDQLIRHAYRLPGLFEEPSPREQFPQSRARPQIWDRKDRYDFLLNQFTDNLEEIHELLEQERLTDAGRLIDRTAQSCRQCHNTFRYR